jgi:hypothetical protein
MLLDEGEKGKRNVEIQNFMNKPNTINACGLNTYNKEHIAHNLSILHLNS